MTRPQRETHKVAFRMTDTDYNDLMLAAACAGSLPGPYVKTVALKEARKGKKLKERLR